MEVSIDYQEDIKLPLLLDGIQLTCGVGVNSALINVDRDGRARTVLSNHTWCSVAVEEGSLLGVAEVVEPIQHNPVSDSSP